MERTFDFIQKFIAVSYKNQADITFRKKLIHIIIFNLHVSILIYQKLL